MGGGTMRIYESTGRPRVYPRVGGGSGAAEVYPRVGGGERMQAGSNEVYPRVGGGTIYQCRNRKCCGLCVLFLSPFGLDVSPRGRGNLGSIRSIPAWAGEPY